jgi:hypothetical protein
MPHDSIMNFAILDFVAQKIARLRGVAEATVANDGAINVITANGIDRRLREEALDIGKRAMVPVRVFYRMPDGAVIGESKLQKKEGIEDYYTPIYVRGFAGAEQEAPPEEVAAEPKGAEKLKRIRAATRGRPVVGWKLGDKAIRRGTEIQFKKGCSLAWTMGRSLNVKEGAKGKIVDLSTKRPIAYLSVGGFEGVELPVHMLGTIFDVSGSQDQKAANESAVDDKLGYLGPELKRIIMAVGFGRVPGVDDTNSNTANWSPDGTERPDPYIPSPHEGDEDMISSPETMDPSQSDDRFVKRQKQEPDNKPKLVLGRK